MSIKNFFKIFFNKGRNIKTNPSQNDKVINKNFINSLSKSIQSIPTELKHITITELNLSRRVINSLQKNGIFDIKDLTNLTEKNLLLIPNMGRNSLRELKLALEELKTPLAQQLGHNKSNVNCTTENRNLETNHEVFEVYCDIAEMKFEEQNLSTRLINSLKNINVFQVKDIFSLTEKTLSLTTNMGQKTLQELKDFLSKNGLSLGIKYKILEAKSPQISIPEKDILCFEEFITKNFDKRTAEVILRRYTGNTLQEIAQEFHLSRERVRQISNKLQWKKWKVQLKEDRYSSIFQKYNWDINIFYKVFQENKYCFNYLQKRYGKGKISLQQALEDENLTEQQKNEIFFLLNNKKNKYSAASGCFFPEAAPSNLKGEEFPIFIQVPENLLRKCRYCGDSFIPASGRQEICKKESCQKKRHADNIRAYQHRKKLKL